jgi:1,4-dihydroxy-2-naphthoate octaprenyltransferase
MIRASSPADMPSTAPARSSANIFRAWVLSLRLRTLPLACCGIMTGSVLAYALCSLWQGKVFWLALATAVLLQILANLANDYGDFLKSADTPARIGPWRGMHLGLITPAAMKKAILAAALLTVLMGSFLLAATCDGWQEALIFLLLGLFSLVAALTYTVGRHAYGYRGLGDASVLVFFGWIAVCGSFYLHTRLLDWRVFLPATACGLLSVAVLNINNMRDIEEDTRNGKMTLAARLGLTRARQYYLSVLSISLICLLIFACLVFPEHPGVWFFLFSIPFFARNATAVRRSRRPEDFRAQLPMTLKLNIVALGSLAAGLLWHY